MKVSVVVITYNHERYIRQALDSVLAQQTCFDFEVLITEDCSTDATREIVQEYALAYPKKIRLLLSESNVHSPWVVQRAIEAARGEYVATLDGDDYWPSPHKLQKQAEFMDAHPRCVMSWHQVEYFDESGRARPQQPSVLERTLWTQRDILLGCPVESGAVLLRRNAALPLPDWYRGAPVGDFPLWVHLLQFGSAGYLPEIMGVYRIHSGGMVSGRDELGQHQITARAYSYVYRNSGPAVRTMLRERMASLWLAVAIRQRWAADTAASRRTAREALRDCPHDTKLLLLAYAPWLWAPARSLFRLWGWFTDRPQRAL